MRGRERDANMLDCWTIFLLSFLSQQSSKFSVTPPVPRGTNPRAISDAMGHHNPGPGLLVSSTGLGGLLPTTKLLIGFFIIRIAISKLFSRSGISLSPSARREVSALTVLRNLSIPPGELNLALSSSEKGPFLSSYCVSERKAPSLLQVLVRETTSGERANNVKKNEFKTSRSPSNNL